MLWDSLFLLENRPFISMAAGSLQQGRQLARLPALTHPQDNCIPGNFGKEKMKPLSGHSFCSQVRRSVPSTVEDVKESESRASALGNVTPFSHNMTGEELDGLNDADPAPFLFRHKFLVGLTRKAYWRRCPLNGSLKGFNSNIQGMIDARWWQAQVSSESEHSGLAELEGIERGEVGPSQKCRWSPRRGEL